MKTIYAPFVFAVAVGMAIGETHKVNPAFADLVDSITNTEWSQRLQNVFPSATEDSCHDQIAEWIQGKPKIWLHQSEINFLQEYEVFYLSFFYKLLFDQNEADEYLGDHGQYTDELLERHQLCKNFWETTDPDDKLDTHNVLLLGANGTDLRELSKLVPTLELLFELPYPEARNVASDIQHLISYRFPGGYINPLLSLNAFAVEGGSASVKDKTVVWPSSIVMGDGLFEYLEYLKLERDGPDFIHSHEFGHHMQYQVDIDHEDRCDLDDSRDSKRLELMADAFSSYFLAHRSGGDMTSSEIDQLFQTAYSMGDCSGADATHGTPKQRECAAMWGAAQAKPPAKSSIRGSSGTILHPEEFRDRFDNVLHHLLDVNQSVCSGLVIPNGTKNCESDVPVTGIVVWVVLFILFAAAVGIAIFYCCRPRGACRCTQTVPALAQTKSTLAVTSQPTLTTIHN